MPTGYTAAIADGITFDRYVWDCARAFGALVMLRDDDRNAPIPERFEPADYHTKAINEAAEAAAKRFDAELAGRDGLFAA